MKQGSIQMSPVVMAQVMAKIPSMRNSSAARTDGSLTHPYRRRPLHQALPAAGNRNGTSISNVGSNGNYWSTTSSSATNAYNVNFNTTNFNSANSNNRYNGFSVRLASVARALT